MFTACGIRWNSVPPHPGHQQVVSSVLYTTSCKQSSGPEDGRNYRPGTC